MTKKITAHAMIFQTFFLFTIFFIPQVGANQYLPEQLSKEKSPLEKEINDDEKKEVFFFPNKYLTKSEELEPREKDKDKDKKGSPNLPNLKEEVLKDVQTRPQNSQIKVLGTHDKDKQYREHTNLNIIREVDDLARKNLSMIYFLERSDFQSQGDIFNQVFKRNPGKKKSGLFQLSYQRYLSHYLINILAGANVGISYLAGRGTFGTSQDVSNTVFKLWSFPLDLTLAVELSLWQWIKFSAQAGPSAIFLAQSRSDRIYGEKDKSRRQLGRGYFWGGKFLLNLSKVFPSLGIRFYSDYSIGSVFLTGEIRQFHYEGFKQKELKISGLTYGLGLRFEFL